MPLSRLLECTFFPFRDFIDAQMKNARNWRPSLTDILLYLILIAALLIRLAAYDAPIGYQGGDGARDYVVASHAIQYGEFPINGPYNGTIHALGNSPLYYYLLIAIAALHNTQWFVNLCFVFSQWAMVLGIFAITNRLFGTPSGLIAALVVTLSPALIRDSAEFVWQPFVMEPVLILSVFLFVKGYQTASSRLLMVSVAVLLVALALHMSVLAFLPLYAVLLFFAMQRLQGYAGIALYLLLACAVLVLEFAPPLLLSFSHPAVLVPVVTSATTFVSHVDPIAFWRDFQHAAQTLVYRFFWVDPMQLLRFSFPVLGIVYVLRRDIAAEKKYILATLCLFILQQLFADALLCVSDGDRHLIPADWALAAAIGTIVYEMGLRVRRYRLIGVALGALFFWSVFNTSYVMAAIENIARFDRPRQTAFNATIETMAREIVSLQVAQHYPDYHFFNVYALRTGNFSVEPAVFLEPLERWFGMPFMRVDDSSAQSYRTLTGNAYTFLVCTESGYKASYSFEDCMSSFKTSYPSYVIVKMIHDDPVLRVFLAKRSTN